MYACVGCAVQERKYGVVRESGKVIPQGCKPSYQRVTDPLLWSDGAVHMWNRSVVEYLGWEAIGVNNGPCEGDGRCVQVHEDAEIT